MECGLSEGLFCRQFWHYIQKRKGELPLSNWTRVILSATFTFPLSPPADSNLLPQFSPHPFHVLPCFPFQNLFTQRCCWNQAIWSDFLIQANLASRSYCLFRSFPPPLFFFLLNFLGIFYHLLCSITLPVFDQCSFLGKTSHTVFWSQFCVQLFSVLVGVGSLGFLYWFCDQQNYEMNSPMLIWSVWEVWCK